MKAIFSSLLLVVTLATATYSQPLTSKQIDTLTERTLKAFDVPGIAVCVIKDGRVIHSKGYGVRSLDSKKPVDENTLFGIASNSKAFTAAALGILVDEGKLKWDDKVRDYIPEFKLYDPFVTEAFTIRDLLTHRSGLGLGSGDLMLFPSPNAFTLKEVIYNLRYLKPVSQFRTKYDYDNNMYVLAGEVVARVSGMSWDAFIERRIMKKLGMSNSAGSYARVRDHSNEIDGHAPVDGKVQVVDRDTMALGHSAGGIYSSIADLSKWVKYLLSDDTTKKVISEDVKEEMFTSQTIIPVHGKSPYNTHFASYGFGFFLSDVKGYKQVTHTGGLEGMVTQVTMIPELGLGIIVLTNQQEGGAFSAITNQVKDSYLGITGTDRVKEYSARRAGSVDEAKKITDAVWTTVANNEKRGSTDIREVKGTYKDSWFGEVTISVKNGKAWFESKKAYKLKGQLFFYKANTYVVKWTDRSMDADAFVTFTLNEEGKTKGMTMNAISPNTDFSFDFQDLNFVKVQE